MVNLVKCSCFHKKTNKGMSISKLSLFHCFLVSPKEVSLPLKWWKKQEARFLIVGFLVKQFLAILGFQIKTKTIFTLARIMIGLRHYRLKLINLDNLMMIYKNWPSNVRSNCYPFPKKNVTIFFTWESKLLEECEGEIEDIDFFDEDWTSSCLGA